MLENCRIIQFKREPNWFVKESNVFLSLAASLGKVQTRIHHPLPGESASAGTEGAGEEGPIESEKAGVEKGSAQAAEGSR